MDFLITTDRIIVIKNEKLLFKGNKTNIERQFYLEEIIDLNYQKVSKKRKILLIETTEGTFIIDNDEKLLDLLQTLLIQRLNSPYQSMNINLYTFMDTMERWTLHIKQLQDKIVHYLSINLSSSSYEKHIKEKWLQSLHDNSTAATADNNQHITSMNTANNLSTPPIQDFTPILQNTSAEPQKNSHTTTNEYHNPFQNNNAQPTAYFIPHLPQIFYLQQRYQQLLAERELYLRLIEKLRHNEKRKLPLREVYELIEEYEKKLVKIEAELKWMEDLKLS